MYDQFHESITLPVGIDIGEGSFVRSLTLRPVVMSDMPRIAELAGDDPTVLRLTLARWCCQVVGDNAKFVDMDALGRLLEPDYAALEEAAARIKKKLQPSSAG